MNTVKRFFIGVLIINMLFLNGCWNYREMESISLVTGIAIDQGKDGHKYHLTFEFIDLTGQEVKSKLLETEGDTIFDAVRNAVSKSEKKLFFSECKIIIINKDIASQGISPILDFGTRDSEPRLTLNVIISREKTAGEIFQQKPVSDAMHGVEISKMLTQNSTNLSDSYSVSLYEANNMMAEDGSSLALPAIKISKGNTNTTLELAGTAIFKSDKLVGFLDKDQTKFLLFIKNRIKGGLLLTSPDLSNNKITLEISNNQTKITPVITNDVPTINIDIKMNAVLAEDETSKDYATQKGLDKVEQSANKTLEKGISDLIKTVQVEYGSDIFSFGNSIYKNNPKWWKKSKSDWGQTFLKVKCNVNADVNINNTALEKSKIKVGD